MSFLRHISVRTNRYITAVCGFNGRPCVKIRNLKIPERKLCSKLVSSRARLIPTNLANFLVLSGNWLRKKKIEKNHTILHARVYLVWSRVRDPDVILFGPRKTSAAVQRARQKRIAGAVIKYKTIKKKPEIKKSCPHKTQVYYTILSAKTCGSTRRLVTEMWVSPGASICEPIRGKRFLR